MKKTYMQPNAEIIKVAHVQILAGSLQVNGTTDQESDLLGRDYDFDDED